LGHDKGHESGDSTLIFFFNLAKLDLKEVTNQTQSPYCVCVTLTSS